MSVIPQEDNLVISFSEAAKLFNPNAAGLRSVPISRQGSATGPQSVAVSRQASAMSYGRAAEVPRQHHHNAVQGTAGVVPSTLDLLEQAAVKPNAMIELRNPHVGNEIEPDTEYYRNFWFSIRGRMRVYFAEFLGTMVLVMWGEGTCAQVIAARRTPDDFLSIAWGWGIGFLLAISLSSGISGGHINPAVTIALAVFRKFSWRKVPGYIAAQLLGAFVGAAIIYGVYRGPLHALPGGYAGVLTTGPAPLVPTLAQTFFSVFTAAALLMGAISVFTDTGNNPATAGMTPLLLGLIMVGIATSFGYQTGFVLNPARDLGPRLLVWATGYSGHTLWLSHHGYGIWIPTVGTILGALFGNGLYDLLIYNGRDSPLNINLATREEKEAQMLEKHGLYAAEGGYATASVATAIGRSPTFSERKL